MFGMGYVHTCNNQYTIGRVHETCYLPSGHIGDCQGNVLKWDPGLSDVITQPIPVLTRQENEVARLNRELVEAYEQLEAVKARRDVLGEVLRDMVAFYGGLRLPGEGLETQRQHVAKLNKMMTALRK